MELQLSLDCPSENGEDVDKVRFDYTSDDGSFEVRLEEYISADLTTLKYCRVEVVLERSNRGTVDSRLEGGYIIAKQRREVDFILDLND